MSILVVPMTIGLLVVSLLVFVPSLVFFLECLAALLPEPPERTPDPEKDPKTVVLVPAHDESAGISATLESLKAALGDEQSILVVADNCTDDTAALARANGVDAVERHDPDKRGKGYAIVFGLEHLAEDPPDVVIIVDADCRVSGHALRTLARRAVATGRPVQADYVLTPPEEHTPMSVVSGLAVLVKNKVRPSGLRKLTLPCHLTGSGMAFPWEVIRKAPPTGAYLVEDMLIGIELALLGHAPISCADAEVTSELPERDDAAKGQRRRWEHGHLATLLNHGPALVVRGAIRMSFDLIAMGLDLLVPPLALLVMLLLGLMLLTFLATLVGVSSLPFSLVSTGFSMVAIGVSLAWLAHGRKTLPLRYILFIPVYVIWKVPLYFAFFFKKKQDEWERTER